jgi:hypothetical protein
MNEQIKLPAQEWLGYDPEKGDLHGYTFEQMCEFAELIVRECADICYNREYANGSAYGEQIEKHFGVEE